MEIRARYVQMGAFTLAMLAAGFAFVYWLNTAGALRSRAVYQVRFESPVSGLLAGSAVLFNGIRVGEVTALELNPEQPRQVLATIAIARSAPVRADTAVGIDFQGLTGSPAIALTGGSPGQSIGAEKGAIPLLVAEANAGQSVSQSARDVLRRLDAVLAENAKPLQSMLASLDTFAGALARNSDRVDSIVAGLERMTGGPKARAAIYDLAVPRFPTTVERPIAVQVAVQDPSALATLDNEKVQSTAADGASIPLNDVQWSDALPKLLQTKIIRGFDDAHVFAGVNRPLEGLSFDFQLMIDVRKFQLAAGSAQVELAGKVVDARGRIVATQAFAGTVRMVGERPAAAVAALDQAFATTGPELMAWVAQTIAERTEKSERPKAATPKKAVRD